MDSSLFIFLDTFFQPEINSIQILTDLIISLFWVELEQNDKFDDEESNSMYQTAREYLFVYELYHYIQDLTKI